MSRKKIETRDAIMMIATGQQRVGKTFQTTKFLDSYIKDDPTTGKKGQKVLIFDTNMEYTQYKSIGLENLKRFIKQQRPEIRRVLPLRPDGNICDSDEKVEILEELLKYFAKGLLVLEDINNYLIDASSTKVISAITTIRHREVDLMIHYQSLAALPPRMWQNASVIRFHKQQDTIDRYKSRIPYYEQLKIAEYLVNDKYFSGNERFFCYVSGSLGYIRGEFTKQDIENACRKYAEGNSTETQVLSKRYRGEKNAYEKAVEDVTQELLIKYYK